MCIQMFMCIHISVCTHYSHTYMCVYKCLCVHTYACVHTCKHMGALGSHFLVGTCVIVSLKTDVIHMVKLGTKQLKF